MGYDEYFVIKCYAHKQEWRYQISNKWWRRLHFYMVGLWPLLKFSSEHAFFFCRLSPMLMEAYWKHNGELAVWYEA